MTVTIKGIEGEHQDIVCGDHDMVLIAARGAGGVEMLIPHIGGLDFGQSALMAAAAMIARDKSFAEMMVEWGKAHSIYERSIAGEYDDREK